MKEQDLEGLLGEYGDTVFKRLARIFNFVFEYQNEDYAPITPEWLADNMPIRGLKEIVRELLEQNQLGGLLPFWKKVGIKFKAAANTLLETL